MPDRAADDTLVRAQRICNLDTCNRRIPAMKYRSLYCCDAHKQRAKTLRREERYKLQRLASGEKMSYLLEEPSTSRKRKGRVYRQLKETFLDQEIIDEKITATVAAQMLDTSVSEVMRAMAAITWERARDEAITHWEMAPDVAGLFPRDGFTELKALGLQAEDTPEFQHTLNHMVECWVQFQSRYFLVGSQQVPMVVKPFHREWVAEFIVAVCFGLKVLIIAPPRHGKTEVLMRFLKWLYVMFENRQTLWVGSASSLVKNMASGMKEDFELNEKLRLEVLPPGKSFVPSRQDPNRPWGANEFTLATRTAIGLKSPTVTALGATAKIPGRDVTDLVIDDIEDFDSVQDADQREKRRGKHGEIMERKEPLTWAVTICSRQHPEDIPHHLMEKDGNEAWRVHVYSAHADWCDLDPDVIEGHDTNGCVLFPEVRPYSWLMERKAEYESLGLIGRYEMRILNQPSPTTGLVFNVGKIRENSLDHSRTVGIEGLPAMTMFAGIDPASRGTQAAFAWGWTETTKYMIDLETQRAGGFAGAFELIEDWVNRYGILTYVYEDNSGQIEFFRDPRFYALMAKYPGLQIVPHTTGVNKHNAEMGITTMAPDAHNGTWNLPFGDAESRKKVNEYLSQLAMWSTDGKSKRGKTDIKMASWFPWPRMLLLDRRAQEDPRNRSRIRESAGNPYPMSYPELDSFSTINEAPW